MLLGYLQVFGSLLCSDSIFGSPGRGGHIEYCSEELGKECQPCAEEFVQHGEEEYILCDAVETVGLRATPWEVNHTRRLLLPCNVQHQTLAFSLVRTRLAQRSVYMQSRRLEEQFARWCYGVFRGTILS